MALFANTLQEVPHSFTPLEQKSLYKELSSSPSLYTLKTYNLKKGWNRLITPKDGVDVQETFKDISKITYVTTYDTKSKSWAIMSNKEATLNMLFLKYLEPNITFFVLAKKDAIIEIKSNTLNSTCKAFVDDESKYAYVMDSGIFKESTVSDDGNIALQSRYYSHHIRGIYDDTRVMLIYPKYKSDTKRGFKYGPANPKVAIKYPKVYEGKKFYLYDFKQEKCFMGIFPSMKIPPFAVLKEIK